MSADPSRLARGTGDPTSRGWPREYSASSPEGPGFDYEPEIGRAVTRINRGATAVAGILTRIVSILSKIDYSE